MLAKIRKLLSSLQTRRLEGGTYNLGELTEDLEKFIIKNEVKYAENEAQIEKLQLMSKHELEETREEESLHLKRCKFRRVASLKNRAKRLSRRSKIYNDNIVYQEKLIDHLESIRAAGTKKVSEDQLNQIALEAEEDYANHQELISDASAMIQEAYSADPYAEDPELEDLAEELGL